MSGNTLPDDMDLLYLLLRHPLPVYVEINGVPPTTTTSTTTTTTTETPDPRWLRYNSTWWIMYQLRDLPEHYLQPNNREGLEITFQTDRPDGLIWFTGNERDNMHLSMKV